MREQPVARLDAERAGVERRAVREGVQRADGMDAPEEAAHPFERIPLVQLRGPAAAARVDREAEGA